MDYFEEREKERVTEFRKAFGETTPNIMAKGLQKFIEDHRHNGGKNLVRFNLVTSIEAIWGKEVGKAVNKLLLAVEED